MVATPLQSGEVQAIVLDNYVLEYAAGSRCDLVTVGNDWKQVRAGERAGTSCPRLTVHCHKLMFEVGQRARSPAAPRCPLPCSTTKPLLFLLARILRWSAP